MPKIVRYSLIVLSLVIVLLLAAPFFIDANSYKGQIEQAVEDATGRTLSIGNMDASLFPWVGVELEDVRVSNRAGFAQRDFLSIERLHVKLALLPLLSQQIEIKHFEVVAPVLYLQRRGIDEKGAEGKRADGKRGSENNWSDLIAAPDTAAKPATTAEAIASASAAPALAVLQAESISLSKGKITWLDADAAPVVLSDLDIVLRDVQLERPVAVRIAGKLSGNAFELDAHVGPVGDLGSLNMMALPLQGQLKAEHIQLQPFQHLITGWPQLLGDIAAATVDFSAHIEQRPDGIRLAEGEVQVQAAHTLGLNWKIEMPSADQLKINHAGLIVNGNSVIKATGSVQHLSANPSFDVRIDGQPMQRIWLETLFPELKAMYGNHPAAWKQLKFHALLAGDAKRLNIRDLQLKLDHELLRIAGDVVYAKPDIRLRMNAKELHLDPWLPQGDDKVARLDDAIPQHWSIIHSAIAAADSNAVAAEPDLRFLKSWKIAAQLKVKSLWMRGMQMGDFSAMINGNRGHIKLDPLTFKLAGGKVTEKASLDVTAYPVKWKESVHISGVQAGPLLKVLADMDILEGRMDMDTRFHATGLTPAAVNTLNGRGTVLFQDGKLKGVDIAGAIRKFTDPKGYQAGPKETDFARLSGSFDVKNGIASNQDLFMASPLLRITGKGTIDLIRKTLDYEVKPRIVGTLKGQGDSLLRRGLSIPLHIYGPFNAPKIRPIINAKTLLQNVPALLGKGSKSLGGNLGDTLGGLLGGGKPASSKPASAKPAQQPKQQPAAPQLPKGLSGFIPGF